MFTKNGTDKFLEFKFYTNLENFTSARFFDTEAVCGVFNKYKVTASLTFKMGDYVIMSLSEVKQMV